MTESYMAQFAGSNMTRDFPTKPFLVLIFLKSVNLDSVQGVDMTLRLTVKSIKSLLDYYLKSGPTTLSGLNPRLLLLPQKSPRRTSTVWMETSYSLIEMDS